MAGHSKWANTKHRKMAQDARRGKIFTKLIREITVAARTGGADSASNPRLRDVIAKALTANMTRDTIERAINRGAGANDAENYEELRYEGYGAGGVAVMVDCLTDNRNRTASDVRHAFSKNGGNLGTDGSVSYLFVKQGILTYPPGSNEDEILAVALEAGAEDVRRNDDDSIDVLTSPEGFHKIKAAMEAAAWVPEQAELTMQAGTQVNLQQVDAERVVRLVDMLEDLDDVQNVYTNAAISDDIMAKLSG